MSSSPSSSVSDGNLPGNGDTRGREVDDSSRKGQISKPPFRRYFHRGQSDKASEDDYLVMRSKKGKLAEHDKLLKQFREKEALVSVLGKDNPKNVIAVMEELIARRKLLKCLSSLDRDELGLLLKFLHKHTAEPTYYSGLLFDLAKKVAVLRAKDIASSDELTRYATNLKRAVDEEVLIQPELMKIQGMISTVLRSADRKP